MQDFTNLTYTTYPRHQYSTEARIKRDASDLDKIQIKLADCTPFTSDPTLRNIVNEIVAGQDVNVYGFESVGNKIIKDVTGMSAFIYKVEEMVCVVCVCCRGGIMVMEVIWCRLCVSMI